MRSRLAHAAPVSLALLLLSSCGGSDDDGGATAPDPSFVLAVSPASLTIQAGRSATLNILITRSNFNQPVSVTFENLSAGVTVPAAAIGAAETMTSVTVSVAANTGTGASTISIRATGGGLAPRLASVQLVIYSGTIAPSCCNSHSCGLQLRIASVTRVAANVVPNERDNCRASAPRWRCAWDRSRARTECS